MKYLLLLCLSILAPLSNADDKILELNAENLTQLALKNSSSEVLDAYALHILKTKKIRDYFKFRKDKDKLNELIQRERKLIDLSLKDVPNKQKFLFTKSKSFKTYNSEESIMNLGNVFQGNLKSFFRAEDNFKELPNYFFLLIPNIELQNNIKINKERFDRRQNHLISISKKNNKSIYLEYVLSFEKFQNQQDFQVVIDRIDIYTSSEKKTILGTAVEQQAHNKLIDNWLLSEGYTNPLIGIHAFSFSHNRLQDQLINAEILQDFCVKTKKIGKHTAIVCTKTFSKNIDIIVNYLGGKVAQIDVVAHGDLQKYEIPRIKGAFKTFLKLPKLPTDYKVVHWSDFNVDFELFSDAFNHKTSKRSTYTNIFEEQDPNNKRTIILSLMAHKTKELLSELGVKL